MSDPIEVIPIAKIAAVAQQVARAESAPAPVRRRRIGLFQAALAAIAGVFAVLTFLVKTMPSFLVDLQITRAVQLINIPGLAPLMSLVSWLGFAPQAAILVGLIALAIYGFGLHWEAATALIAALFSTAINLLAKGLIQRPRPAPELVNVSDILNSYSFPSGHVMFYVGFFGFIGFLAFTMLKPSPKRGLLLTLFGGLVASIGPSRIYLGAHWASDVLGAYLLGSLMLAAIVQFYIWGKIRFFVHQPVAAAEPQQN